MWILDFKSIIIIIIIKHSQPPENVLILPQILNNPQKCLNFYIISEFKMLKNGMEFLAYVQIVSFAP